MKKILLFLILLTSFSYANLFDSPIKLKDISNKLPELKSIKCKFKQEKYLKNIQKPIISSGDFEFIENEGVFFYTKYPIESKTDFTNEKYKQINYIIKAISNKNYSKLENEFNFYYEGKISDWSLGLKPKKNSQTYDYISSISIKGTNFINKIIISQTNGNETIIWFTK